MPTRCPHAIQGRGPTNMGKSRTNSCVWPGGCEADSWGPALGGVEVVGPLLHDEPPAVTERVAAHVGRS